MYMKKQLCIVTIVLVTILTSCSKDDANAQPSAKAYFQLWNKCEALTTLQQYVEDVTNPQSPNFISVEDRIATFDMDGTFIGELYPTYFEYNLLEYRALDDPTPMVRLQILARLSVALIFSTWSVPTILYAP